jgi:hypothetical protein
MQGMLLQEVLPEALKMVPQEEEDLHHRRIHHHLITEDRPQEDPPEVSGELTI